MALDAPRGGWESGRRRPRSVPQTIKVGEPGAVDRPKAREHTFEALRGLAMFLFMAVHSALAYVQQEIPGVIWCVRDAPTTPLYDWFCWWSMGLSNPLCFTMAGFFAAGLYDVRGFRRFVENRAWRIALPFLVGVVTVLPACLAVWSYGWLVSGRCTWPQVVRLKFHDPAIRSELFGTAHLWFLQYLLVMLGVYAVGRGWSERRRERARWATAAGDARFAVVTRWVLQSRWCPLLLATPTTAVLWWSRQRVGIDAALDRHNSFLLNPIKLAHFASFFLVGVALFRLKDDLERLARRAPWYLAASIPVFVGRAWLLGQDWTVPLHGSAAVALAALGALFSWLAVLGAIGAAHRVFRRPNPTLSYLADSSYWIYLTHMPVLGLIQGDLYLVSGHAVWKMPIALIGTLAIGLASYHCLVRYTALGVWLHGVRTRSNPVELDQGQPGADAGRRRDAGVAAVSEPSRRLHRSSRRR